MTTNSRTWKKSENRAAVFFGARRQPLSGSCGRSDITRSDSTHPQLFIETKYRKRHATRTLYDGTKALARKEGKTPVLVLVDKGRPGFLLCIHGDDFEAVAVEFLSAKATRGGLGVETAEPVRQDRAAPGPGKDAA